MNGLRVTALWTLFCVPIFSLTLHATPPAGYYLVWSDEFNRSSLDTSKWDYWLTGSWRNAVNTPGAVSLNGTNMVITTYTSGSTTYTAMLATDKSFCPRYGYWEANIQWGDTNGMWSAIWLRSPTMGTYLDNSYASGGELDIAEHRYVGIYETNYIANIVSCNIHWNGYGSSEQSTGSPNVGTGLDHGFHTYGLLWTSNSYTFNIDGAEAWSGGTTPPFGSDAYLILSSEVDDTSTTWAGYIPSNGYPSQASSPAKMMVDYVRYYAPTNVLFWTGASSAYWNNSANWVSNMAPVSNSDLTFSYLSGNRSITLGQDFTVDGLIFLDSTNAFSISGANVLTVGVGGIDMVAANNNVTLNAPMKVGASQTWAVGPNNPGNLLTVNASLSGSATLTKASCGTLLLSGTNTFSGALNIDTGNTTNDGIVLVANPSAMTNVASVSIRNTGSGASTLQLSNSVTIPAAVNLAGRNTNVVAIESVFGNNKLAGGLTLTGGGSNYLIQADLGTLTVGGAISAGSTATGSRVITFQGSGTISVSAAIQDGSSSALGIMKTNSGTLTLAGAGTFTGGTTNFRGNLIINGSVGGPLMMKSGTLAGIGSIDGTATIQSGCELSPGTSIAGSIGAISFGSNLTLAPGSMTYLEINAALPTNDVVNVVGTLNCGGTLYVANLGGTLAPGQNFQLLKASNLTGSFSTLTLPALSSGLAWNTNLLTNGILSIIAVSPAETLGMTNSASGKTQLNWSYGVLQCATNIAGPFNTIPGAVAPYPLPATNAQEYYRIRED